MRIPLFDEILRKAGVTDTKSYDSYYEAMFKKLLDLKGTKKKFYGSLSGLESEQRRKLADILTEDKDVLMWIQCFTFIIKNKLEGVPSILAMKKFSCSPKNIGIFKLAKKFEEKLSYFSTLKPPMPLKQTDALITEEINYFKPFIKNMVRQKMLFLKYSNAIDLNDQITEITCHFISRMHSFIPLYRGVELKKMLNRCIKNQVINQINFYTAEKRKSMETNENDGICYNKTISQNCGGFDGEDSFDLLDKYQAESGSCFIPTIKLECSSQIRRYENKNDGTMVEILKILSNDSPTYVKWYNERFGTSFDCPVQASESKNFLNSVADFCKITLRSLKEYLSSLKPTFHEILAA